MANEVFANDLEIACKAADGKSLCAFPDPCMVTPCPTSPPVIIPLPNTVYAKHIKKGSKSVRISGKEVAKKDKSFFKKSTGNEIAKWKKGLSAGVKKGKAYFTSWSMNVKVEGENVCRHTDSITHNHGSFPGNTGINKYIDDEHPGKCKKALADKERECAVTQKENDEFVDSQKERNKRRLKNK